MAKSLLDQLTQLEGTRTFFDDMKYDYAENCGRHYSTGTLAVVSGSVTVTDSTTAFTLSERNNFVVIDDGNAAGVYQVTTASGLTANVTPTPTGTDAAATYRRHYYQNLEDDLNYLRKMMELVIGEGQWNEEPNTDLKNMAYLIPTRPNYIGETGQYAQRPGTVGFAISDIDQTGLVSTGNAAGEYTDNTSNTTAGSSLRFTDDNTMVISVTGGFYPADSGVISIYKDGAVIGTLDLAARWTTDSCVYEEDESDVGNNPDYTASNTGTDIINLTGRKCMNVDTDGFPYFWPGYQITSMTATLNLPEGFAGQIYVVHTGGGTNQTYTYSSFWVDTSSQSITASAPAVTQLTPTNRYLSGVPYYDSGSTFTISGTNSDTLFDEGYVASPCVFGVSQFNSSNVTPTLADFGLTAPLDVAETLAGGAGKTITVGAANFRDLDARATATYYNVFTNATSASSAAGTFRIDTYDDTGTTDTVEPFNTESRRMLGDEDFTDITVDEGDSNFNSATNITTTSGLVEYNGTLKYPTLNHTTFLPAGPNYSSASGDFYYYRVFEATGAFSNGTITFSGWANGKTSVESANIDVHLRMPNCVDYSNSNTDLWQDLGVAQSVFGGNGCQGAGSTGSVVGFSFGTASSSSYGNRIIMRIKYAAGSVTALTGITFSPSL